MGVNKVILIGNLGKDPEVRYTQSQTAVCTFSLATGERKKDPNGNWVDHTEWHNIVCFNKTAEFVGQYLKKGRQVFIEGKIQTRKWQDKEGKDRYTTEILANNVQFVGNKESGGSSRNEPTPLHSDEPQSAPSRSAQPVPMAANGGAAPAMAAEEVTFDDDDIPF